MRLNNIIPVFIYMVGEPSTKVMTRKKKLPNKESGSCKIDLYK